MKCFYLTQTYYLYTRPTEDGIRQQYGRGKPHVVINKNNNTDYNVRYYHKPNLVFDEDANRLAIAAGFEGRAYIGTYLRELISTHQDTLALVTPN